METLVHKQCNYISLLQYQTHQVDVAIKIFYYVFHGFYEPLRSNSGI
jgi:hypothetical protein